MSKRKSSPSKEDSEAKRNLPVTTKEEDDLEDAFLEQQPEPKQRRAMPEVSQEKLKAKFLCSFPYKFISFWEKVKKMTEKDSNPCDIFKRYGLKHLRLVGIFDYLAGNLSEEDENNAEKLLMHYRFPTDLPEMQTLAVCDLGHFAYWRDTPEQLDPLIVFVEKGESHFPKMSIIGVIDPTYIVCHCIGKQLSDYEDIMYMLDWSETYNWRMDQIDVIIKEREKLCVGNPLHGLGLMVKVVNFVGYRPINEQPAVLKEIIIKAGTADDESGVKAREKLMELMSLVQFANDEMDFGMGLELGHDVFCSNYPALDKMANNLLSTAYTNMGYDAFARILELQMRERRGNPVKLEV